MLRFRLRTLLIAVAVLAVPCAWVGWQLDWIRQRRAIVTWDYNGSPLPYQKLCRAPGFLWLFGESGISELACDSDEEAERLRCLFPEADVMTEGEVARHYPEQRKAGHYQPIR